MLLPVHTWPGCGELPGLGEGDGCTPVHEPAQAWQPVPQCAPDDPHLTGTAATCKVKASLSRSDRGSVVQTVCVLQGLQSVLQGPEQEIHEAQGLNPEGYKGETPTC